MRLFCWTRLRRVSLLAVAMTALALTVFYALLVKEPDAPLLLVGTAPVERDLAAIRAEGVLRVAIPDDQVAYDVHDGITDGWSYDLARRIARRLDVELEVVRVTHGAAGLRDLARGRADLLAAADTGPRGVVDAVAWTEPLERAAPVLLGRTAGGYRRLDALHDATITVAPATNLERLAQQWRAKLDSSLTIRKLPADQSEALTVAQVASGEIPLLLVDERRARLDVGLFPSLQISPPLDAPLPIRWALRPNAPELSRAVADVLEDARRFGLVADLERRYLENPARLRHRRHGDAFASNARLSPWDGLLRSVAADQGLDWRLLAALSFTESRFDASAIGPGGSAGLFQLMPATARRFGAEDPLDPAQNAEASARHLRWLLDLYRGLPPSERLNFALATFNLGIGHMEDARELARQRGLSPDRFTGHVATVLPLLEDPAIAAQLPHGLAPGRGAIAYITQVMDFYRRVTSDDRPHVDLAALAVPRS